MKELKTLTKSWKLLDDASELHQYRMPVLKEFILRAFENYDLPTEAKLYSDIKKAVDDKSLFDVSVVIDNYHIACNKAETEIDSIHIAFSMICLRENEDQLNTDLNFHKDKLKEMFADGLKADVAGREVINFTSKSPFEFRNLGEIIQYMRELYIIKN